MYYFFNFSFLKFCFLIELKKSMNTIYQCMIGLGKRVMVVIYHAPFLDQLLSMIGYGQLGAKNNCQSSAIARQKAKRGRFFLFVFVCTFLRCFPAEALFIFILSLLHVRVHMDRCNNGPQGKVRTINRLWHGQKVFFYKRTCLFIWFTLAIHYLILIFKYIISFLNQYACNVSRNILRI